SVARLPLSISSARPTQPPPRAALFPYTALFRSDHAASAIRPFEDHKAWREQVHRHLAASLGVLVLVLALLAARRRRFGIALGGRSEEHTSELQSRENVVCRLLLAKKNS